MARRTQNPIDDLEVIKEEIEAIEELVYETKPKKCHICLSNVEKVKEDYKCLNKNCVGSL